MYYDVFTICIYNTVLVSAVQQVTQLYTHSRTYAYSFLYSFLFHDGLSQEIEYSSLCYPVGPCCPSIQ